jgi:hypothetical protein
MVGVTAAAAGVEAMQEQIELLFAVLCNLFEAPFESLRFPDPGAKFDERLEALVASLAGPALRGLGPAAAARRMEAEAAVGGAAGVEAGAAGVAANARAMARPAADFDLVYAPGALLQSKVLQHLLEQEGKAVADLTAVAAAAAAARNGEAKPAAAAAAAAPVLLVFLSAGVAAAAVVRRALVSHPDALLVAVHEADQRKASYFGPEQRRQLDGFASEDEEETKAVARLAEVESMPLQRRSYLQRAMVTAIIERMREAVAVPALGSSGRASLQRQLSSIGVRRSSGRSGRSESSRDLAACAACAAHEDGLTA